MKNKFDLSELLAEKKFRRKQVKLRPIRSRLSTENSYIDILHSMLREITSFIKESILPEFAATKEQMKSDDVNRIENLLDALREMTFRLTGSSEAMINNLLQLEEKRHQATFAAQVKTATGVDISAILSSGDLSEEMALVLRRNVALITSLGDDASKRVEHAISNALMRGETVASLSKTLNEELGVVSSRADFIARDQTAKWTSDLNRLRQTQAGVDSYEWSTSKDERVRPSHREKEGKIFQWSDPPADTGHPGEDYNCRCTAIAVIDL